jgi:hypothetical protein
MDRRGRVAFVPFADPEAVALLESLPEAERFSSWHLALPDGRLSSRGGAVGDLFDALGLREPAALVRRFERPVERAYALVATHREILGQLVPDGRAPRRSPR